MVAEPAGALFAALLDRALSLREEVPGDLPFLDALAAAASPLAGVIAEALLHQQAVLQRIGHQAAYPGAMKRIVLRGGTPVGRVVIDWGAGHSRCVDLAIVPAARGAGIGTALLGAWLATADRLGMAATLQVRRDSPAVALYRRLGLVAAADDQPMLTMVRPR